MRLIKFRYVLLLLFVNTVISALLLFEYKNQLKPLVVISQVQGAQVQEDQVQVEENLALPVRLIIPAINVDAKIQQLGITPAGDMDVPTNVSDTGWYKFGPRPGQRGSAVIAGHLNGPNGGIGVFADLSKLKKNDEIFVEDENGKSIVFTVRESRGYDSGYAYEVFTQSDGTYLNLITCDGLWDESKNSYSKRLVVFAE